MFRPPALPARPARAGELVSFSSPFILCGLAPQQLMHPYSHSLVSSSIFCSPHISPMYVYLPVYHLARSWDPVLDAIYGHLPVYLTNQRAAWCWYIYQHQQTSWFRSFSSCSALNRVLWSSVSSSLLFYLFYWLAPLE